jgi:ketosteroid isomerase-like protein
MGGDPDAGARRARNEAAVRGMFAAFSSGDPAGLLAHVAEELVYEAPWYVHMPVVHGREAMAGMLAAVQQRFSEIRYDIVDVIHAQDPDFVIAEVRGDHQVKGSPARYRNHYLMFMRFRDGRVVHWREFSNPDVYRRATGEEG